MAVRKYRVREGFTYGAFGQYGPGTIVELDEDTAKHVMDKLELAEIVQNVPTPPPPSPEPPKKTEWTLPPLPVVKDEFPEEEETVKAPAKPKARKGRTGGGH